MAFSNKVSVEILDCNFSDGFYRQASIRYTSKLIKTTVQLVTGVNNLCHRISHFIMQKLQKTAKIEISFLVTKMDIVLSHK